MLIREAIRVGPKLASPAIISTNRSVLKRRQITMPFNRLLTEKQKSSDLTY